MKTVIALFALLLCTPSVKADRPIIYLKITEKNDQLFIQSRLVYNGEGNDWFTAEGDTVITNYTIKSRKIRVEAYFPIQKSGRSLNATTYVNLKVYIDGESSIEIDNFGQHSDEFVSKDLYSRPLFLKLCLDGNNKEIEVSGEYSRLLKNSEISASEYPNYYNYEKFELLYSSKDTHKTIKSTRIKSDVIKKYSKLFNSIGENKYGEKDFYLAKICFLKALRLNENFVQAYSNLALVYQKEGNISKAFWANEEALQVLLKFYGKNNHITKASSNYNLGQLFEGLKDYPSALKYYKLAESSYSKKAYQSAIDRVFDVIDGL